MVFSHMDALKINFLKICPIEFKKCFKTKRRSVLLAVN